MIYDRGCLRSGEEWVHRNLIPVAAVAVAARARRAMISAASHGWRRRVDAASSWRTSRASPASMLPLQRWKAPQPLSTVSALTSAEASAAVADEALRYCPKGRLVVLYVGEVGTARRRLPGTS